jgi:phenylacetate-CoA ligase
MNLQRSQQVTPQLQAFLTTPVQTVLHDHSHQDPPQAKVDWFRTFAARVPAYQQFLTMQGIDLAQIEQVSHLPITTKANYIQAYPLGDRCRDRHLDHCDLIAMSSGSTGTPTAWPRSITDELDIAYRFEQLGVDSFRLQDRRTLAVICFAMGTWVGGVFSANCCRYLTMKGYPLTVVTPGNQPAEIFRVVESLGAMFDQIILFGYPPFLKDVIDAGRRAGIPWANYSPKLVVAGEVINEAWRSLVCARIGSQDPVHDCVALYGTADAGVLGNETPLSITVRRWLAAHPVAVKELFGEERLPTLVQYDPHSRYFEVEDGFLVITGNNGVPLFRYGIGDQGGVFPYETLMTKLKTVGFDPASELVTLDPAGIYPLPFVYVFGRGHFALSYFGANIYPETVMIALEQPPLSDWVTGKFVLEGVMDEDQNPALAIAVELALGVEGDELIRGAIAQGVLTTLLTLNSEFANYVPTTRQCPQVQIRPTGDPDYFPSGVKHRYTR